MTVKIGLDVDNMAYDFFGTLRNFVISHPETRKDLDPDLHLPAATCWDFFLHDWGMTLEQYTNYMIDGINSGYIFWKGDIYPDCYDTVSTLYREGYEIKFITSRDIDGVRIDPTEITKYWLSSKGLPFHEVIVSNDKTLPELDIDVLFDDSPGHIEARTELGLPVVAFDQPWNSHLEYAERVHGWSGILKYVKENFPLHVANPVFAG